MDGVNAETFNRGWTPYIKSLLDNGHVLALKEDLISRGWAEMLTGEHALRTGALYEGPLCDGSITWSDKFRLNDIDGLDTEIKPLWQVLNERGYRVGIMNVPTTYPAPRVEGFFVSGGGGGGPVTQEVVREQCHPEGLETELQQMGYIVDERLNSLLGEKRLYAPKDFFAALDEMTLRRTMAFIELSKRYPVDLGFVVYKSSTVTTETMLPPELEKAAEGMGGVNHEFINAAERLYRSLDDKVKYLVGSFPGTEILLVSDHAMAVRKWSVNANAFLVETGLQVPSARRRSIYDFVKSWKHHIPHGIKRLIKKNPRVKSGYQSMATFDPRKTMAFSLSFSNGAHGIYINDDSRFGGPVSQTDIVGLKERIVREFNNHPVARRHGMKAYGKPDNECREGLRFPDVILDLPDGYITSTRYVEFVVRHENPLEPLDLHQMAKDPRWVGKAHTPLAVNATGEWQVEAGGECRDLTLVYRHIVKTFPSK